jgi:CDP-glycerol glycerophosphotransferase (TagB/SpsB family)
VSNPLPETNLTTITYAPTWEGEDDANNYTSVDLYGPQIARAALAIPGARFVYKPHPRVALSDDPKVHGNHNEIVTMIKNAGGEHAYLPNANILGVLPETNVLISDVSSVTLDHLYLAPDSPILLTDRRSDRDQLLADSPMATACDVIDAESIGNISEILNSALDSDSHRSERSAMRTYYFGDGNHGSSTQRFWSELERAITEHDVALQSLQRVRQFTD